MPTPIFLCRVILYPSGIASFPFLGIIFNVIAQNSFLLKPGREGGDNGLFITLVLKVFNVFLFVGLTTFGTFIEL